MQYENIDDQNKTSQNNIFQLEPRLQEYLNRKRFFKKNSIDSKTLEREYQITKRDRDIIVAYLSKNKAKQADLSQDLYCEYVNKPKEEKPLTSKELMQKDPRFQRLRNKMAKEKAANNVREDISNLSRNYDLFANTEYASMGGNFAIETQKPEVYDEFTNEDSELNEVFKSPLDSRSVNNNSRNLDYNNEYFIDNNIDPLLNKHKQSNIQYNQVVYNNQYNSYQKHQPSLDNISSELSSYQKKINKSIDDYNSDRYYNNNILNTNSCKKEPELRDVNIENYVKYGYPTSKNKSIGRENPAEHYFQYIDPDIQDPDHVCFERPQLSRLANKQSVRYKKN